MSKSHFSALLVLLSIFLGKIVRGAPFSNDPSEVTDFYKLFNNPDAHLSLTTGPNTIHFIEEHGYPAERHYVTTEDGYIISLFRIPYSHNLQNQNEKTPIVFIQHGLFASSDGWPCLGPDDALPFLLSDAGYDVWMGNARGNRYSRNHTTRSTSHPDFWRFSWHEIAYYDIAAAIDYTLSTENGEGQEGIHYVGHSQGTTVMFVLLSSRPEYNDKIKTAHMLAPVAFMDHMDDIMVNTLSPYLGFNNVYSTLFCSQEFLPYNDFVLALMYSVCLPGSIVSSFCSSSNETTVEQGRTNTTADSLLSGVMPAGISTDQVLHYMQEHQSGHFRQFDFGTKKNLKIYGTEYPPDYPTELITTEMHLWYSDNDEMSAVEDVLRVAETLPNKVMHHMEDPLWDHMDFATNWEVRKYINNPIIAIINDYEGK
ncbi:lipase 3-like [Drosophila ficusphila]|uniref:lipase 3-like n=1 Tax=Drosophila ficusphila TaxID=30025 RepID=UPI0007E72CE0|nr:lipase 3-like [Drosophila ficusphila]